MKQYLNNSQKLSAELWLNTLKIALVNRKHENALALLDNLPHFEKHTDLLCARALVEELSEILQHEKKELFTQMDKLKQAKQFLLD